MGKQKELRVAIVSDIASPHQNVFFEAVAARGEVDIEVLYCRKRAPARETWAGLPPLKAPHRYLREYPIGSLPTNPGLVPRLLADPGRLPFVIGYYLPSMLMAGLALGTLRRPWVFWTDTMPPQTGSGPGYAFRTWVRRFFISHSTICLSTGRPGSEALIQNGCPPPKVRSLPFVVDTPAIARAAAAASEHRGELRGSLGVPEGARLLVYVGQMIRRKGIDLLLEALSGASPARPVFVLLIGDGPDLEAFKAQASELAVADLVFFHPGIPNAEVPRYLALADGFVLPSRFDPWPVVVVEAVAAFLPVIGSDACGSVTDCVSADSGWIFKSGEAGDLAAAIEEFGALGDDQLAAMGASAARRAGDLSPESAAAEFTGIVEDAFAVAAAKSR